MLTRKYDGRRVIHSKYGEGVINGVNIMFGKTSIGVDFKEEDDTVFRMFTLKTLDFFIMIITNNLKI